ncbi:putative integral membrane protein [Earliella scabrosa]|nr:putative integral membrane protein [Earliella scabrosa]
MSAFSRSRILHLAATTFGTIFVAFGVNAILRPDHALTFFQFARPPANAVDKQLVDALMAIYGVRDIFMGLAIYAAALWGTPRTLGVIVLAGSTVAFADGAVCKVNGMGEWDHWGYAPMLTLVGGLLLGSA